MIYEETVMRLAQQAKSVARAMPRPQRRLSPRQRPRAKKPVLSQQPSPRKNSLEMHRYIEWKALPKQRAQSCKPVRPEPPKADNP